MESRDADEFPVFHGNSRSDAAPPLETPAELLVRSWTCILKFSQIASCYTVLSRDTVLAKVEMYSMHISMLACRMRVLYVWIITF